MTTQKPSFLEVLSIIVMAAPIVLVPAAFVAFEESILRAQTIVTGLEWTLAASGIALALRALRNYAPERTDVEHYGSQAV
ncbi:flagellar protein FliS [Burkholderiales bacterium GJ-E10]|nr:flagellar protein FliS [Burkholderiales bacterium GJ-E10]